MSTVKHLMNGSIHLKFRLHHHELSFLLSSQRPNHLSKVYSELIDDLVTQADVILNDHISDVYLRYILLDKIACFVVGSYSIFLPANEPIRSVCSLDINL
jgi:hypothetical protein